MSGQAVRVQGLSRAFGAVRAVDGLDMEVPRGKVFGYLGPNGAGKTTTIHLLLGLLAPDAGRAEVLGHDVRRDGSEVRRRCGVLLEHDGLYERLSARDNLAYHARLYGVPKAEAAARADAALEQVGWAGRGDEPAGRWSRGMKRRLAVLRAFTTDPELVFLDEPTSGFDPRVAAELRAFLKHLTRESDTTVFLTTHDMREAESVCDEVAVLRGGRLVAQGPPGGLRDQAPSLRIAGAGFEAKVLAALRRRKDIAAVDVTDEGVLVHLHDDTSAAPIVAGLVRAGVAVESVERRRANLEDDFIALMEGR